MNELPATPTLLHVLLVDDHQMVIEGIKTLLRPETDIRIVAQAGSGDEALQRLQQQPEINLALVDLNMPQMTGPELIRAMREHYQQVPVLAMSVFHDHASVTEVLEAGGAGYLLKSTTQQELSAALRAVAAGRTFFSPEVGQTLLQNMQIQAGSRSRPAPGQGLRLTAREQEVLQLIAREYSNQHIAEQLFISERTVETHRKNILTKTNSKSVVGLIQYAMRHKLIS